MGRISLWKEGKHSNDYKWFDRQISEQFTVGGTGIYVHKYLGAASTSNSTDATQPNISNVSTTSIQDVLFGENRDRVYDSDIYRLRGIYQVADQDFDLSQFGLFLAAGTLFMVFHINNMVEILGRKIMNGDVLELPHLRDYYPGDNTGNTALRKYFSVTDCTRASEGFSATWWPHLWRVKLEPLTDSQENQGILNSPDPDAPDIPGSNNSNGQTNGNGSNSDFWSQFNNAIIKQGESDVPLSGYDTSKLYTKPILKDGSLADPFGPSADAFQLDASSFAITSDESTFTPDKKIKAYLGGDGLPPNNYSVIGAGSEFPFSANIGDYFLRTDYVPSRLFRFNGSRWSKVEDIQRANLTLGPNNNTLRNTFFNDTNTYTDINGNIIPERQSLSKAPKIKPDN